MEPKTILVIIGVLITALFLKSRISNNKSKNENRPANTEFPGGKVDNDKIVLIENASSAEIKKVIQQFCNSYNQEGFKALPLLTIVSANKCIVTFPFDIDFENYCYFINYLYYPNDIFYKPIIKAWTTTKINDAWMKDEIVNKKVMLYVPVDDKDHDNVYLTTSAYKSYKMGFALGESSQQLSMPKEKYSEPIKMNEINPGEVIQFK